MADKRSVVRLLQAHDRRIAQAPMPIGAKNRIAARLAQQAEARSVEATRRSWLPMLTFAAGAALVMLVIGYNMMRRTTEPASAARAPAVATLAGYAIQGEGCDGKQEQSDTVLSGECRMVGPHLTLQTWDAARLQLGPRAVTVQRGQAMFDVAKVGAGEETVTIAVSHGTIEVLGTRFTVDQDEHGGTVDLFEGQIRFHHRPAEGRAPIDIRPGQRYAWGNRAAPQPSAPSPGVEADIVIVSDDDAAVADGHGRRPRPNKAAKDEAPDADAIIAEVTDLRSAGRYDQAAKRLRQALGLRWDRRTAQVLSYELGQILERHLHDANAACKHWAKHQRKYPEGRYAGAVATSLQSCP